MNHSIGDRVRIDCSFSIHHGRETTIRACGVMGRHKGMSFVGYEVDVEHSLSVGFYYCIFEAHELIPINDKYDGMELSTWDDCVFKPKVLVA